MYNHTNCDSTWPFITHVPSPGYWYFIHGGAGAIMSRGLMDMTSFERCQEFITSGPMPRMSGGKLVHEAMQGDMFMRPCYVTGRPNHNLLVDSKHVLLVQ